jgi:hypothetical protein
LVVLAGTIFRAMLQLITILNRCHHFRGFVYQQARFKFRPQEYRDHSASAQTFDGGLFALPPASARL